MVITTTGLRRGGHGFFIITVTTWFALRAEPLGVTSEIARLARYLGDWAGWLPARRWMMRDR